MMPLTHCKGCGKMIGDTPSGLCDTCKGLDPTYSNLHKVKDYLYENPNTSISVVAEDTGVSVTEIAKYIREGALKEISGVSTVQGEKCACGKALDGSEKICKDCKRENERLTERVKKELTEKIAASGNTKPAETKKAGFYTSHK